MKQKRPYSEMIIVANKVKQLLEPDCYRIEIAGSLRRKCELIGDIEIVCIPKPFDVGLFESGIAKTINKWEKVRGEPTGKYTQRILPEGIKLDLFFAERGNWGAILLIRTGDWEFSKKFMGTIMPQRGYIQAGGFVTKDGGIVEVKEEKELFELMKIPYIEPVKRDKNVRVRYCYDR